MRGFNSKLVRLKARVDGMLSVASSRFQFQTGSIKSQTWLTCVIEHAGFNSKLVRLKEKCIKRNTTATKGFNSKLVRLKVAANTDNAIEKVSFNSKLVRLKE